ncbi:MAG: hypothetical protein DI626_04355 [Micavibrio aeruginosavorus]|uniref:Uncharacterized protein n=1 Tax=Micavibrio aeruginosavorus TaxID=349221 RepID=A0A2W4ZY65_9BACT|nr:MAG: hypothetical protein DI626_04355 [Micavibrio aeruginosavorus]
MRKLYTLAAGFSLAATGVSSVAAQQLPVEEQYLPVFLQSLFLPEFSMCEGRSRWMSYCHAFGTASGDFLIENIDQLEKNRKDFIGPPVQNKIDRNYLAFRG